MFLDITQGIGLSLGAGLRPFLPTLLVGALASGDLGLDFDGTSFAFLEAPVFLGGVFLAAVAGAVLQRRVGPEALEAGPAGAALAGIGIGLGALLFGGTLDDRHDTWWWGLFAGAALALFAQAAGRSFFARVRGRLDPEAQSALSIYADAAGLLIAGLSVAVPPFSLVALAFLAWLLLGGRRRSGEKYAGLRILR